MALVHQGEVVLKVELGVGVQVQMKAVEVVEVAERVEVVVEVQMMVVEVLLQMCVSLGRKT